MTSTPSPKAPHNIHNERSAGDPNALIGIEVVADFSREYETQIVCCYKCSPWTGGVCALILLSSIVLTVIVLAEAPQMAALFFSMALLGTCGVLCSLAGRTATQFLLSKSVMKARQNL
eukprot:TRINITY_DN2084_c0_g1_i2.p1 TRINITY_DN2084_c0_g1~~TRINITY_DN2084_c0_g1_i2.p1  ORF type:complete len:118 (+),score=25.43 TRINITY_DN2084_c0_g1_i2:27-380(+)